MGYNTIYNIIIIILGISRGKTGDGNIIITLGGGGGKRVPIRVHGPRARDRVRVCVCVLCFYARETATWQLIDAALLAAGAVGLARRRRQRRRRGGV